MSAGKKNCGACGEVTTSGNLTVLEETVSLFGSFYI